MIHEVMQSCLIHWTNGATEWDEREMDNKIDEEVKRGLGDLLKLNISVDQAKRELKARAVGLQAFQKRYISDMPKVGCRYSLLSREITDNNHWYDLSVG